MMRVYIISTKNNISLAEMFLEDIQNVKAISNPFEDGIVTEPDDSTIQKIQNADMVLAIIDEKFSSNLMLNMELGYAQSYADRNKNQILIPIVIDGASVPFSVSNMVHIKCDTTSESDISKTKYNILQVLERNRESLSRHAENKSNKTLSMIILTLAIELFAVIIVVVFSNYILYDFSHLSTESMIIIFVGLTTVVMSLITLLTSYLSIMKRRRQEDDNEEIASYSRRLKQAIIPEEIEQNEYTNSENEDKKNEIDALGRMLINLEDIKEFYTWSQKQAKGAFILAVAMCILGLIFIIAAIPLSIIFKLSFQVSIIPAIGGVTTELIAGTALIVYKNSLLQLNHYHKALHEDERFLSGVNLIGKFSTVEAQDDMLREIIRSEIQMNLVDLTDNKNIKQNNKSSQKKKESK